MSFLSSLFSRPDINAGVDTVKATPGALLVDVRTREEYVTGHIPGSMNIPSDNLQRIQKQIRDLNTPLFLYCLSGSRSSGAARLLRKAGYANVTSIGGVTRWRGTLERGK